MSARRLWLAMVILLVPVAADAHLHKADLYAGGSLARGSTLGGIQETISITLPNLSPLSILGDLSFHFGSREDEDVSRFAFMTGLRWMLAVRGDNRHLAYGQFLVGGVHDQVGMLATTTEPAVALGGGYEFDPNGEESRFAARFQIEYVVSGGEDFPRASAGIVYRFRRQ